jgi:hypothetical protein
MAYVAGATSLLPIIGVQGNDISSGQHVINVTFYTGFLLARVYVVTNHKQLVLVVLGILGCCAILSALVCVHVFL